MHLDLDPDQLLSTTRSVRRRLDLERPVTRELVEECIELALQAPTGSNSQGWHWVVVEDPATKAELARMYAEHFDPYIAMGEGLQLYPDDDTRTERSSAVSSSAKYLRDHFAEVPVLVVPCIQGRLPETTDTFTQASFWGSILPAVWSFMLALRSRGLGSAWTTLHLPSEREAAELLGIPFDQVTQAGLFPVAHTIGTDFKPAPRLPLSDVVHWDRW
ncbi:MAG: nitroreductase family protein [Acidobacteria bacterium]|nr:nitroreductase family protein [Acidobacteriota bacterium]